MNVDFYRILDSYGTNKEKLRAVFTARPNGEMTGDHINIFERERDKEKERIKATNGKERFTKKKEDALKANIMEELWNTRVKFENRISGRVLAGRRWSLENYRFYIVTDLAMDSVPIVPENIPLQLYAQGHINLNSCVKAIRKCKTVTTEDLERMIVRDPNDSTIIKSLNLPRLNEIAINLVRATVRRRVAAQANKYNNLYPYYSYEPRSKTMVQKLRGEVLSQRVEIMTDQQGYRHDFTQNLRKNFMYSSAVTFVKEAWMREKQMVIDKRPSDETLGSSEPGVMKEVITREGVPTITPHPTRRFHDMQYSLASINYDNGCTYLGYWDAIKWRNIKDNPKFWNMTAVPLSNPAHFHAHQGYFDYYCPNQIKFAPFRHSSIEEGNKRDAFGDVYANAQGDSFVWITNYYEKIVPKDVGLGGYPHPVWLRTVVASDRVVIYAEILPSRPAAYMGHDEDDSKILNQSMVHEIIPYQDQATNLMSQALHLMKIQGLLVMGIDTDQLDPDQRKHILEITQSTAYYSKTLVVEHSASEKQDIFGAPQNQRPPITFTQTQAQVGRIINDLLKNVAVIIEMMEKNQMMSPQEIGQFSKRETTAQEVFEVGQTTSALFAFISEGPDEYRAAMKRILHDSLLAIGSEKDFEVFVQERYPDDVIKAAGFRLKSNSETSGYELDDSDKMNLVGSMKSLSMDVIYNSRDGSERTISTAAAKVLSDLTRYVLGSQEIFQVFTETYGLEQFTNMISEVFRLSGSGFVLKVPAGSDNAAAQIGSIVRQLQGELQQQVTTDEDLQAQLTQLQDQLSAIAQQLGVVVTNTAVASGPATVTNEAVAEELPAVADEEIAVPPALETAQV